MTKTHLQKKVLDKIQQGKVRMKPKVFFVLKSAAYILGMILTFVAALYLVTFIYFLLSYQGSFMMPGFGLRGIGLFLLSVPWFLILLILILLFVLEVLAKHFKYIYQRPLIYSVLGITVFFVIGSLVISSTKLHMRFEGFASRGQLPLAGRMYKHYGLMQFKHSRYGIIMSTSTDHFIIRIDDDKEVSVQVFSETRFFNGSNVGVGDHVWVAGTDEDGFIRALGIKKVNREITLPSDDAVDIEKFAPVK